MVKNRNFGQRSKLWPEIKIVPKNQYFGQKSKFVPKNRCLCHESQFLLDIEILARNPNFC